MVLLLDSTYISYLVVTFIGTEIEQWLPRAGRGGAGKGELAVNGYGFSFAR